MTRLLHAADLHLGKRFGALPAELSGRLSQARMTALERLAAEARAAGAATVLLAGDSFDSETPAPAVLRQALQIMREADDLRWIMLPGNHDSLAAEALWERARRDAPANLTLALTPEPLALDAGATVLPAPVPSRRPGCDPTEALAAAPTPPGVARIGLAHGAVADFGEAAGAAPVPPDRAVTAGLAYLALGDWHGQRRVGPRAWYAGAPEPDRFRHDLPGRALLVTLRGPDAEPEVAPVETGGFLWLAPALALAEGEDPAAALAAALPPAAQRRRALVRLTVAGRARLTARAALAAAAEAAAPDFAHWEQDLSALRLTATPEDLDVVDRGGALRAAAEALAAEAADARLDPAARAAAEGALALLAEFAGEGP